MITFGPSEHGQAEKSFNEKVKEVSTRQTVRAGNNYLKLIQSLKKNA